MAQQVADRRDVDFVLHEQLKVETLSEHEQFEEFNKKTIDLVISEARNLAIKELLSCMKEGDEEGCRFENGTVKVPASFHKAYKLYSEGEWIAMCDDPDWGVQGLPHSVALAASNYFNGANFPFVLHNIMAHGAGKLVEKFGTDKQKALFLKKMYNGKWGGTMLLTEPDAGSDVGALTSKAVKNEDGTYSITGNKIFISSGDNDLVENIIHPVLARIEGAPAGTPGISLFLVPKIWVNDDGSLGEPNDVICTGIEEKMGIHGSPTASLTLGGKGMCRGTLLGTENKGMSAMFVMMNEARLYVGMQGFGCASASYLNALNYARERIQGKHLTSKSKDDPSVPIIQHPDIRRTLLSMKSHTEGMRSILFYVGFLEDQKKVSQDDDQKARYQGIIDVLIPIAKGYITERSFEVCSQGVQVFGGYGYTTEYPQEQLLRDCKITQIYEGTNAIQAMDLMGRKLALNDGQSFRDLLEEIEKTISSAGAISSLKELVSGLDQTVSKLKGVAQYVGENARSEKIMSTYANAQPFLDVTGDTIMAWMMLWRAVEATQKLDQNPKKKDMEFYEGQLKSAQFFIQNILPVSRGKMDVILANDTAATDISEAAFGG